MTSTPSDSPIQCIDVFLGALAQEDQPAEGAEGRARVAEWLIRLRASPDALRSLEAARRAGLDVLRLLVAASLYRDGLDWLEGPLTELRIGPMRLDTRLAIDIDEVLADAAALESKIGCSDDAKDLRAMKATLDELEEEVREDAGKPRTCRVRDGRGGYRDEPFVAQGGFVARGDVPGVIGPGQATLRKRGRGAPGDPALDVLAALVLGHIRWATREVQPTFAAGILLYGLGLGDSTGATNPLEAMRARLQRCIDGDRPDHLERAARIARILRLSYSVA